MRLSKGRFQTIPWYLKPFFWRQKRKYGQYLEPAKVWASMPKLFLLVLSMYAVLVRKSSPIDPVIRSLVSTRVSQMNGCTFCVDLNTFIMLKHMHHQQKVDALSEWRNSRLYSPA